MYWMHEVIYSNNNKIGLQINLKTIFINEGINLQNQFQISECIHLFMKTEIVEISYNKHFEN